MDNLIDHCVYEKYMVSCSKTFKKTNLVVTKQWKIFINLKDSKIKHSAE